MGIATEIICTGGLSPEFEGITSVQSGSVEDHSWANGTLIFYD